MSPDIRTAERLLRAGGFSRRQARALLAGGWRMMEAPPAPPPAPEPAPPKVDQLATILAELRAIAAGRPGHLATSDPGATLPVRACR